MGSALGEAEYGSKRGLIPAFGNRRCILGLVYLKNQSGRRKEHEKEDDSDHQELNQAAAWRFSKTLQI